MTQPLVQIVDAALDGFNPPQRPSPRL